MSYVKGFPTFSIEKPMVIPWRSKTLLSIYNSGEYIAELKLNEHRGFLCIDDKGQPSFHSYRGPSKASPIRGPALEEVKKLNLPKSSIFDAGHFFRKDFSPDSRIWIIDVLVISGEKIVLPFADRLKMKANIFKDNRYIWLPPTTSEFIEEFQNMIKGKSLMIKNMAAQYGISHEILVKEVEGLVIKKLSGCHSFPQNKKEVSAFLKLRVADVNKKEADWVFRNLGRNPTAPFSITKHNNVLPFSKPVKN